MIYNKIVEDCFFYPQHVGELAQELPYVVCGTSKISLNTAIKFYWQCDKNQILVQCRFKAVGNPYLIAGLEWVCRQIEGRKLDEVQTLDYLLLIRELDIPKTYYPIALQIDTLYKEMIGLMNIQFAR